MIQSTPETLALVMFSFIAISFLGGLVVFHALSHHFKPGAVLRFSPLLVFNIGY